MIWNISYYTATLKNCSDKVEKNNMEILNVYSISGLFYELYHPNVQLHKCEPLDFTSVNPLNRLNALFWADLLSLDNIDRLLKKMEDTMSDSSELSDIEKAVLSNKTLFTRLVHQAPLEIVNQANSEKKMFSYMEQIEIACKLFSKYLYAPFSITIQDGFQEPSLSSKVLINNMLDNSKNPYLGFLGKYVFRHLDKLCPKMIWINGQPKLSSLAIAGYLKQEHPNIFVGVRYHSSEYFSLNKIDDLLLGNTDLFSLVDCVVLDDSRNTCFQVERAICDGNGSLADCPNIIYIDRSSQSIRRTHIQKVTYSFDECINRRLAADYSKVNYISPSTVANLRLNPNTACYWNKCTFCAINKKYKFIQNQETETFDKKINYIEDCIKDGVKYIWFEDEAIPPDQLDRFADLLLHRGIAIYWQVRSRIDTNFTTALATKLYHAGLREIRFGLESANIRILGLMNKFPESITLDTVENIVKIFTEIGIHVHFPMIVGFPTETTQERIETYIFLKKLREKYVRVSYNINVLMLDIASDLFKNFQKYQISSLSFPCSPNEYLGNMINYECVSMLESKQSIDMKRNEFMRDTLYPWMPRSAQIKPNIFYRLSETIRNTLLWHCGADGQKTTCFVEQIYALNECLSVWKNSDGHYRIYNWFSHRLYSFAESDYRMLSKITILTSQDIKDSPFYQALLENEFIVPSKE